MEEITKISEFEVSIKPEAIVQEAVVKEFSQLEADLKQAQDSLVYVQQRHADEIAPIQKTIDLFQSRLDEAKAKGIIAKLIEITPAEIAEEVVEIPVEEIKPEIETKPEVIK